MRPALVCVLTFMLSLALGACGSTDGDKPGLTNADGTSSSTDGSTVAASDEGDEPATDPGAATEGDEGPMTTDEGEGGTDEGEGDGDATSSTEGPMCPFDPPETEVDCEAICEANARCPSEESGEECVVSCTTVTAWLSSATFDAVVECIDAAGVTIQTDA